MGGSRGVGWTLLGGSGWALVWRVLIGGYGGMGGDVVETLCCGRQAADAHGGSDRVDLLGWEWAARLLLDFYIRDETLHIW